jgi:hypothetical protein
LLQGRNLISALEPVSATEGVHRGVDAVYPVTAIISLRIKLPDVYLVVEVKHEAGKYSVENKPDRKITEEPTEVISHAPR